MSLQNKLIYGLIEDIIDDLNYQKDSNKIFLYGFCKSIENKTYEDVEVFLNGEYIDCIKADQEIEHLYQRYEIKDNCFKYPLDLTLFDKGNTIEFKAKKTGENLLNSPLKLQYNEALFFSSLKEVYRIKQKSSRLGKNKVGFFANFENLNDEEFMNNCLNLHKQNKDIKLSAFYFNKEEKGLIDVFISKLESNDFILPIELDHIDKLLCNCEVLLYNRSSEIAKLAKLIKYITRYCTEILSFEWIKNNITISNLDNKKSFLIQHHKHFNFSEKEVKDANSNQRKLLLNKFPSLKKSISNFDNLTDMKFKYHYLLAYALQNNDCKKILIEINRYKEHLDSSIKN